MDNIDISFGDDVLLGHGKGVTIDDYNDNVISSETVVGPAGPPGPAGYSPTANVTQTEDGAIIRITDEQGTTTANVYNGADGISPTATVTDTASGATITITDANGTTTATVNNGEDGEPGDNATIAIGQVSTLAPGSQATVSNVGTSTNAVLDFGIPEGLQGDQGIQGDPGINAVAYVTQNTGSATITIEDADGITTATVYDGQDGSNGTDGISPVATVTPTASGATISITDAQGTTTANITNGIDGTDGTSATVAVGTTTTGNAGTNASVTNSGTASNAIFDFVIPRGADGTNGIDGTSATVTVGTTTTLPEGSSATVTNSGTSSAVVLNFGIPKGDTGSSGVGITTKTDSGGRIGYYFDDGLLICRRTVTFNVAINSSWGSLYKGVNPDFYSFAPSTGSDFIEKPTVSITALAGGTSSYWMGAWENGAIVQYGTYNMWSIPTGSLSFIRPTSSSSTPVILEIIAIGKWK